VNGLKIIDDFLQKNHRRCLVSPSYGLVSSSYASMFLLLLHWIAQYCPVTYRGVGLNASLLFIAFALDVKRFRSQILKTLESSVICYTHWIRQKTIGFLTFSGGIKKSHWTLNELINLQSVKTCSPRFQIF